MTEPAQLARLALSRWAELAGGTPHLVNVSENHTYRVEVPGGARYALRLHRPGYQTRAGILSELAWISALGRGGDLPVPRPLAGIEGGWVQELEPGHFAVLFAFEPGREPTGSDDLVPLFHTLGRYAALAHRHVGDWERPANFTRPTWNAAAILDADGLWGDWRISPQVTGETAETLALLDQRLRRDLAAYGTGPDRFGLIHADMRLANILVDGERPLLLDFDDSGFGWFLYDLAASLSFLETSPELPALIRSWLAGYFEVRPLTAEDIGMIDAMILLRRMALLAWIGSHGDTDLAKAHVDNFAKDTAAMARLYLAREQVAAG